MNRYPLWKNILVAVAIVLGFLYTLPNFFGESPAVQVSPNKSTVQLDARVRDRIAEVLKANNIAHRDFMVDERSIRVPVLNGDEQLKAKDLIDHALNPDATEDSKPYAVALNLVPNTPGWLSAIGAQPMNLGLDLRGGVHFLLQVNTAEALQKRMDSVGVQARALLREKKVYHNGVSRDGQTVTVLFKDAATRDKAKDVLNEAMRELQITEAGSASEQKLLLTLKPEAQKAFLDEAIKQNIETLNKRVNAIGASEPVIQQQGADRIVVQLPGIQDPNEARKLIGRTATLEVRMAAEGFGADTDPSVEMVPQQKEDGSMGRVAVKKQVLLTGDHFVNARPGADNKNGRSIVSVELDSAGGNVMKQITHDNLGKPMAILLVEKGRAEAISVATIQGEFSSNFQISGNFTLSEANTLSILIRSGAIAAPMEIIQERVVGPNLGAENIDKGLHSTLWGFIAIAIFMVIYYLVFGMVSVVALACNLLFLIALLSGLHSFVTLTLPGIAAIALALGMAIDANVLINERIREELRNGATPQAAITAGYERAWATILDSNVTTFIVGIALLAGGSGPVQGFATVHCLGILTSIFSAVVVSRGVINLIYGRRKKLASLAIGQVWRPTDDDKKK